MTDLPSHTLFHERIETPAGPDTTSISLSFLPNGGLRIDGYYSGPRAEAFWGDWDHEFWMEIPTSHTQTFIAEVFHDAFNRINPVTYARLEEICTEQDIPVTKGHWT